MTEPFLMLTFILFILSSWYRFNLFIKLDIAASCLSFILWKINIYPCFQTDINTRKLDYYQCSCSKFTPGKKSFFWHAIRKWIKFCCKHKPSTAQTNFDSFSLEHWQYNTSEAVSFTGKVIQLLWWLEKWWWILLKSFF